MSFSLPPYPPCLPLTYTHIHSPCCTLYCACYLSLQWTLLVFDMYPQLRPSTFTSFSPSNAVDSMPSYMGSSWNHAATNPQIVSSIRISPFPSPPVSEIGQPTSSLKIRIGEGSGAFTPYNMFKRHFKTSPAIVSFFTLTLTPVSQLHVGKLLVNLCTKGIVCVSIGNRCLQIFRSNFFYTLHAV